MKKFILVISLFSLSINTYSQSHNSLNDDQKIIDSLETLLRKTKSDSLKCIVSFKLANVYMRDGKMNLYKYHLAKANRWIIKNKYLKDLSHYYNASSFLEKNDIDGYQKALELANKKLKKYATIEIYSVRAAILRNQAVAFQMKSNDKDAYRVLTEALPLADKANDNEMVGLIYSSIGILFLNRKNFNKAEYYIRESIKKIEKKVMHTISYSETYVETYILYAEILIELNKFDEALFYLIKIEKVLKKYPNSNLNCHFYFTKGYQNYKTENFQKAIINFDKGIVFGILTNDYPSINRLKFMKFSALKELKKYDEAKNLLIETLNSGYIHFEDKKNYSKQLSILYKQLNDFPNALKYSEQYIRLNDSLNKISNENEIAGLEAKFKNKENENKIKHLKIQKDRAVLLAQNNNLKYVVFGLISLALLILIIFIYFYFKSKQRLSVAINLKNMQEITSLKNQKELEVMQAMINGEEAERKRIARDLHDGIGSRLSSLKMQLNYMQSTINNEENLKIISESLSTSINELRQTSFNLVPETLLKLGLELALKDLCYSMSNNYVSIEFLSNQIQDSITETNQITIFRIVQELINNSLKHSSCTEIIVDCSQNKDLFLITVEDDGIGFNTSDIKFFTGLGLKNLKNRVDLLKGKLDIKSNTNKGTIFNIELRIQTKNEQNL